MKKAKHTWIWRGIYGGWTTTEARWGMDEFDTLLDRGLYFRDEDAEVYIRL